MKTTQLQLDGEGGGGLYLHSTHQKEAWPTFLSAMHSLLCEGHSETKSNS